MPAVKKKETLKEGQVAPAFSADSTEGKKIKLADFKGKKHVVLYFYPKDNTPGCTQEACDFRDGSAKLAKAGAVVLGVSPDSVASHEKFRDKYSLPFPLLSDDKHEICEKYGVWQLKKFMGREFMGVVRTTFIIDKQGRIHRIFPKVKVNGHLEEVLAALAEL